MSYVVLALGAFLSLCGALAIYAGYGIIQVERGWASVIAGSTALSCGIVTIALGFILYSLAGLHALLKTGKSLTPLPRGLDGGKTSALRPEPELDSGPGDSTVPEAEPSLAPPPPVAGLRTWPPRPARPHLTPARSFLKSRGTAIPPARGTSDSDFVLPKIPPISPGALRVPQAAMEPPSEPGFGMPDEEAAKAGDEAEAQSASVPAEESPAELAWNEDREPGLFDQDTAKGPSVEALFQEMHLTPGEAGPQISWPAETAAIDAILAGEIFLVPDSAREVSAKAPLPEPAEPESPGPEPAMESEAALSGGLEPASPEPPLPEPRLSEPPAADTSAAGDDGLTIVGRYESEGTSYVMYSDGSIEARTEHAVFHFKSMAELKTFMDSQAQTPQE